MTKVHEEYLRGPSPRASRSTGRARRDQGRDRPGRGRRLRSAPDSRESLEALYARLVGEGKTRREAVKEVARLLGLPAREVYRRVQEAESSG